MRCRERGVVPISSDCHTAPNKLLAGMLKLNLNCAQLYISFSLGYYKSDDSSKDTFSQRYSTQEYFPKKKIVFFYKILSQNDTLFKNTYSTVKCYSLN